MPYFSNTLRSLLGLHTAAPNLTYWQMTLRGVVVFVAGLIMVRMSDRRFFAKRNAFDLILAFLLASMLSRAVNGSGPLLETLVTAFVIVALHRLLAWLACHATWFGNLIKGRPITLIADGKMIDRSMNRNHITRNDLIEDLRLNAALTDPSRVKIARLERNGEISIVLAPDELKDQNSPNAQPHFH